MSSEGEPVRENATFGRLHPSSILFSILSQIRSMIFPVIVVVFGAARGSVWAIFFAAFLFIPAVIVSVVRYFSLRYRIQDGELVVTEGIVFRRIRTVPVDRIQNINLVQNPLHRMVGVAEARIETASGTEPEAVLRVLPLAHVQALRDAIFGAETAAGVESAERDESDHEAADSELLRIPTAWLCRAGLANNRGIVLVGIFFGAIYQFDLDERFDIGGIVGRLGDFLEGYLPSYAIPIAVIAGLLAVLLLLRVLSMAWYVLRFHDYRLTRVGDDLSIRCGLLTKISASVPRRRIQFISVHQNFWMKRMGISSIRIETAGGSGEEARNASGSVSSRWFIPVVADEKVAFLLRQLRDGLEWGEDAFDWQPLSPRTGKRLTRVTLFVALIVSAIGFVALPPWGLLIGVGAWFPLVAYAIRRSRSMRYARSAEGVVYRSGLFTKKVSMTFFDRVQTLRVDQSPFDRRWNMATLCVDTAAAGPAEHKIHIPYLTEEFAADEYGAILARVSQS